MHALIIHASALAVLSSGQAGLPLRIGADSTGGSQFQGDIAVVRLYRRELPSVEIAKLAAEGPLASALARGGVAAWRPDGNAPFALTNTGAVATHTVDGFPAWSLGDGFLQVAPDDRLSPRPEMTVEAWIRPSALPAGGGRIVDRITVGGADGWLLDTYPGRALRFLHGRDVLRADVPLVVDKWQHVAATCDSGGVLRLFYGGRQAAGPAADDTRYEGAAPPPGDPLTLWYRRPAAAWTQALPIGNGRLGGMVWGGPVHERIQLNNDTLWSGEPTDTMPKEARQALPEVRRLLLAGRNRDAHDLVKRKMLGPYFQSYLPLGELSLDLAPAPMVRDYRRELDLRKGVARVRYSAGGTEYRREMFASHPAKAIIMRLTSRGTGRIDCLVRLTSPLHSTSSASNGQITLTGRAPAFADPYTGRPMVYEDGRHGRGMRFCAWLQVRVEGGRVYSERGALRISGARAATLVLASETSYNGFDRSPSRQGRDPISACAVILARAGKRDYASLCAEHERDFGTLFDRVALSLGHSAAERLPTDERVRAYRPGADPGLAALYFQFGRYLLTSGSRPGTQPLNLQGIWNDRLNPPWASNWTLNCNAEINYWAVEAANLGECHLPLIDLARELSVDGHRVAREMYGARGWVAHHNADIWRRATPVSGDPLWAIFQTGGAWLCQHAWEHYAFSGDPAYLRSIWPLMRDAARYFLDSMIDEPTHGWLVTAPATNFESAFRKPNGEVAAVCMGPTADMQMVRELFRNCVAASRLLQVEPALRAEVEGALKRLPPMQVSPRSGELQEWLEDWDHASPRNGQMLTLWGLICCAQITPRGTPALAAAVRKALEDRRPWETYVGSWTGAFSSNAFARLGDGNQAAMILDRHLQTVVNPNLTANFEGMADWQIDGNLGQTAAITEMLLQSQTGVIDLLPALPTAWSSGSVRGLRARGGFLVDETWSRGKLVRARVRSTIGGEARVRAAVGLMVQQKGRAILVRREGNTCSFATKPGAVYELTASAH